MCEVKETTPFSTIYDSFLARITDDMYMSYTEVDTLNLLQELLINAIPLFKFPRFDIFDYEEGYLEDTTYCGVESNYIEVPATGWVGGSFNVKLTQEEINILSLAMEVEWLGQQLATTENIRLKYSGSDFKFTSQANHLAKLKVLVDSYKQECNRLQGLYSRRRFIDGTTRSSAGLIMTTPGYGYKID